MTHDLQSSEIKEIKKRLVVGAVCTVVCMMMILFGLFTRRINTDLEPELNKNAMIIGQKVGVRLQKFSDSR